MKFPCHRLLPVVLVGLGICAFAGNASAYVRTVTSQGKPVFWDTDCIQFFVNSRGCADIQDGSEFVAANLSMDTWNNVDCSFFRMYYAGKTDSDYVGFDEASSNNQNLIIWQSEPGSWTHPSKVLALTSVILESNTGRIVDTDIELNDEEFTFSTSNTDVQIDIQNTITHELGHVVGLDHSPIHDSTMYSHAPTGETKKRTLSSDDIEGVCAIYPIDDPSIHPDPNTGCQTGASPAADFSLVVLVFFLAGVAIFRWIRP